MAPFTFHLIFFHWHKVQHIQKHHLQSFLKYHGCMCSLSHSFYMDVEWNSYLLPTQNVTNQHSLVGLSTDSNRFDAGSNPLPDQTFLLYNLVIYWYHIFLINVTLLLFFHVVFSVLDAALYIGVLNMLSASVSEYQ